MRVAEIDAPELHHAVVRAALLDLGEWCQFEVEHPSGDSAVRQAGGMTLQLRGLLDGRRLETFHLDVGQGEALLEAVEVLLTPALLAFAGIPATEIPCYPLGQQIAEKTHANTRPHPSDQTSRAKDLVDILRLGSFENLVNADTMTGRLGWGRPSLLIGIGARGVLVHPERVADS